MKNPLVLFTGSWLLGIVGLVSIFIFVGGVDPKTGVPDPITVDGQTIEFTWTDDNSGEDLHIYTDKATYTDGISHAVVYVAVANRSDTPQDIELMGYFRDNKKRITDVSVLTEVTRVEYEPIYEDKCPPSDFNAALPAEKQEKICVNAQIGTTTNEITEMKWAPLAQEERTELKKVQEATKLQDVERKSVESFIAEKKTVPYSVPADGVVYYRTVIEFPTNTDDNFFFEAVGNQGGYGHLDPWFNASWGYRVKVEVNRTQVGSSSAITNMPVYLDLAGMPASFWTNASSTGADIRIVESDETTETPFELVSYATTTKRGELHFLADALATTSTSTFYVYYGNPTASPYAVTDPFGKYNVWSTSTYRYVHHIDGTGTSTSPDSTSNQNNLVQKGSPTYQVTGKFARGYQSDGNDATPQGFEITNNATLSGTTLSFSAWLYFTAYPDGSRFSALSSRTNAAVDQGYTFFRGNAGNSGAMVARINATNHVSSQTIPQDQWVYAVFTHTSNQTKFYLNGTLRQTLTTATINTSANQASLGLNAWAFNDPLDGIMEEARLTYTALSDAWILTEYNNQNSTSTFFVIGAQEAQPSSGSTPNSNILWFD